MSKVLSYLASHFSVYFQFIFYLSSIHKFYKKDCKTIENDIAWTLIANINHINCTSFVLWFVSRFNKTCLKVHHKLREKHISPKKIGVSAMKFELCCLRLIFDTMLFFPIAGKKLELATMEKSTKMRKTWGEVSQMNFWKMSTVKSWLIPMVTISYSLFWGAATI